MGWSGGSALADDIWEVIKFHIPVNKRKKIAKEIIKMFEDRDCDTMHETALWRMTHKNCPVCNHNGDGNSKPWKMKKCKLCSGEGIVES
jgi:hypothetical protein